VFASGVQNLKPLVKILQEVNVSALLVSVLWLVALVMLVMSCILHKRRQTEGTYQPSAEERKQAESGKPERPALTLPLPKEERLI
uniref:Crumbs homolog 3b n=1 Tax=Pygocentrus nattereri TaxID=42514 RepID=A0A3B4DWX5_PYGNA